MNKDAKDMTHVRVFTKRLDKELAFDGSRLTAPMTSYVLWLDLMGAGSLMRTSMQKSANALARLHLSVQRAADKSKFSGTFLPINDGLFAFSTSKVEIMQLAQWAMIYLASRFIETHDDQNRSMVKAAIAYGPLIAGTQLSAGVMNPMRGMPLTLLERACFGPPVIQAYEAERQSPPFGVSIHESARAFAAAGEQPFQTTPWLWWQAIDNRPHPKAAPLTDIKNLLARTLEKYFIWLEGTRVFNGLEEQKIKQWRVQAEQYFLRG